MLLKTKGKFFGASLKSKMCMKTKEIRVLTWNLIEKKQLRYDFGGE